MQPLNFKTRNIAITDLETTGLDATKHEIIEIGMVLISQPNLEIIDELDIKVKPQNISAADINSLVVNGYHEEGWKKSISLTEALSEYMVKVRGAIFCAHNVTFDYSFIKEACIKTGIENTMDYHSIDIPSLVWLKYRKSNLERLNLSKFAEHIGIKPEPEIHRAINGAKLAYKVLKALSDD